MASVGRWLPRWAAKHQAAGRLSVTSRQLSLAADAAKEEAAAPKMPSFDHTPQPYTGPKADAILAQRKKFLNPALFLYYKKHVSLSLCFSTPIASYNPSICKVQTG